MLVLLCLLVHLASSSDFCIETEIKWGYLLRYFLSSGIKISVATFLKVLGDLRYLPFPFTNGGIRWNMSGLRAAMKSFSKTSVSNHLRILIWKGFYLAADFSDFFSTRYCFEKKGKQYSTLPPASVCFSHWQYVFSFEHAKLCFWILSDLLTLHIESIMVVLKYFVWHKVLSVISLVFFLWADLKMISLVTDHQSAYIQNFARRINNT